MADELELAGELGPARAIRLLPRAMPSNAWLDVAALDPRFQAWMRRKFGVSNGSESSQGMEGDD
eukprot:scaffold19862_cov58-Phaeocystis_antarctica.AAC.2